VQHARAGVDLLAAGGAVQVADAEELARTLEAWLADPQAAATLGRRAAAYIRSRQGATARNVAIIGDLLGRSAGAAATP